MATTLWKSLIIRLCR